MNRELLRTIEQRASDIEPGGTPNIKRKKGGGGPVAAIVKQNPELSFLRSMVKGESLPTSYLADLQKQWDDALTPAISAWLASYVHMEAGLTAGIRFCADPEWESAGDKARVILAKVMKRKRHINTLNPNSISRIVIVSIPDDGPSGFVIAPMIATLFVEAPNTVAPIAKLSKKPSDPQARGPRPSPEPIIRAGLTAEEIPEFVAQFMKSGRMLDELAAALDIGDGGANWDNSRADRKIAITLCRALMPASKAVFGAGDGEQVIDHALISPMLAAKKAKKRGDALDRDEVAYLLWIDAVTHVSTRQLPPLVKL